MKLVVFSGPTIGPSEGRAHIRAEFRPPASQGDVYRAASEGPEAIGIIDGYFDRVPAIWHKEILWAMSRGISVYGSASMGALRAAELADFGMVGVGRIFDAFRAKQLEDDDEVAVAHGSAELGYPALSEPMVNVRATLARAAVKGVVSSSTAETLVRVAKDAFYADRSYAALFSAGQGRGLPATELEALRAWLPEGRVNQKLEDAIAMLERMSADFSRNGCRPPRLSYEFEHTNAWETVTRSGGTDVPEAPKITAEESSNEAVERLLEEELQLFGPRAVLRALNKQRALAALEGSRNAPSDPDKAETEAIEWYFGERLGRTIPKDLDGYARELGMTCGEAFRRAVLREFVFVTRGR